MRPLKSPAASMAPKAVHGKYASKRSEQWQEAGVKMQLQTGDEQAKAHRSDLVEHKHGVYSCPLINCSVRVGFEVSQQLARYAYIA